MSGATSSFKTIIFHLTEEDKPYLGVLKAQVTGKCRALIDTTIPVAATEFQIKSHKNNNAAIVSTSLALLKLVFPEADNPKISEYAGSFYKWKDTWFLFVDPLEQLVTVTYGKFVFQRYLSKILAPGNWLATPDFKWELFKPNRLEVLFEFFESCSLIAIDIETRRDDPERTIVCMSFTGSQFLRGQMKLMTVVVPFDDLYNVNFARLICSNKVAKVFQNGKYDIAYLLRYNCPVVNYAFDTINLFHCWYSEMPKDLGFISGFMVREYVFHKNEGKSQDKYAFYGYNAKDTYTTLLACLAFLVELPEYAINNFLLEFPVVFPSVLMEHTGLKYDSERAQLSKARVETELETELAGLQTMVANKSFNPNSPQQTVKLWELLGSRDIKSSKPQDKDKVANRHPLNKRIVDSIVNYRENSKLKSAYYKEGIAWKGRCYYALNPHGTDTGRLASRESQFWCGLQIQNIPRDGEDGDVSVKECFVSDPDFYYGEADYAQAEARDTAYLSGDTNLIAAVDDVTKDFHGLNASAFFGVPYDEIVKSGPVIDQEGNIIEWVHKTLNKALRDLSKRTNHGANYNMGPQVMLDTMGIKKVLEAKRLLRLPEKYSPLDVTTHLLIVYAKTYPVVKGDYYDSIIAMVSTNHLLVGPTGWSRYCFGSPKTNKRHLNSYVAHPSQSLNAMTLNRAVLNVFQNVWMQNPTDFKLCAQIHDSILFQYRKTREDLVWKVRDQMIIPTPVRDTFGITRILTVPVDVKGGAERWSDVKSLREER